MRRPRAIWFAILSVPLTCAPLWAGEDAAALGARIAKGGSPGGVAPCQACHGASGGGDPALASPRLAGMAAGYLTRQLRDFRSGARRHPIMSPLVANLSDPEVEAVARHYAALPAPAPAAVSDRGKDDTLASELARWGDWSGRGLPGCSQCHGPDGNGVGAIFPALTAQPAGYLVAQLRAWRAGERANDPLGLMRSAASRLTDTEITALAEHYAAQPAGPATPAPGTRLPRVSAGDPPGTDGVAAPPTATAPGQPAPGGGFTPPARADLPAGPFGDMVRLGQAIFQNTNRHPASASYVGNDLACSHCHLDAGRLAGVAPMWAAWVAYPAYRAKTQRVDTFTTRVQGCFEYSMNGRAPTADDQVMVALTTYSAWLARGARSGDDAMPGRNYRRLTPPAQGFDPVRGQAVYAAKCVSCHGRDGRGVVDARAGTIFPPLWGSRSYNWGAGMHGIDVAAAFIVRAMPLGQGGSLSEQEAWDVAAYVNAHERPQDPRFTGSVRETARRFHADPYSLYGKPGLDGRLLGAHPAQPKVRRQGR